MRSAGADAEAIPVVARRLLGPERTMLLAKIVAECRPIPDSQLLRAIALFGADCVLGIVNDRLPIVGLANNIESRCGDGVPDLPEFDFDPEELH